MSIMPTETTVAATSLHSTATPATEAKKEMDSEVFLALLVAQLRNQDPTSPMDTTEMMAQSTQLASMEQLTALTDTSRESFALQMRVAAAGMVGQEVSFVDADGVTQTGIADSVSFAYEVPQVKVGEWTIPLDAVSLVRAAGNQAGGAAAGSTSPSGSTTPSTDSSTPTSGSAGTAA
ncbi:flagellar hook assembly protein FlgD [Actinotalea sp. C106]|uniref:flagellar hook assembly protein FlgD n=1 Tax=Actinotalea sp. C106 TaxID=2908644 RepID=UPI002028BA7B|nr:flagellar hook capping FlgD N-terminal domain-containing protein [Actinotalea sp. C106]